MTLAPRDSDSDGKMPDLDQPDKVRQPIQPIREPNQKNPNSDRETDIKEPVRPFEPGRGQVEFMEPEKAGEDSNQRSGAL